MPRRAGADHVLAVESIGHLADTAEAVVALNGLSHKVQVVRKDGRHLTVGPQPDGSAGDMQHAADLLVFEVRAPGARPLPKGMGLLGTWRPSSSTTTSIAGASAGTHAYIARMAASSTHVASDGEGLPWILAPSSWVLGRVHLMQWEPTRLDTE